MLLFRAEIFFTQTHLSAFLKMASQYGTHAVFIEQQNQRSCSTLRLWLWRPLSQQLMQKIDHQEASRHRLQRKKAWIGSDLNSPARARVLQRGRNGSETEKSPRASERICWHPGRARGLVRACMQAANPARSQEFLRWMNRGLRRRGGGEGRGWMAQNQ